MAPFFQTDSMTMIHTAELDGSEELYVHVMNAYVKPYGNDPLGKLCGGNISLLCRALICVTLLNPGSFKSVIVDLRIKSKGKYIESKVRVYWDCERLSDEVYLLPVKGSISGLVIVPTAQEQGQYKRVGLFKSLQGGHKNDGTQELTTILMNPEYPAGTDAFADFTNNSMFEKEHWVLNIV